jgi:hypothetical protein
MAQENMQKASLCVVQERWNLSNSQAPAYGAGSLPTRHAVAQAVPSVAAPSTGQPNRVGRQHHHRQPDLNRTHVLPCRWRMTP